MRELMIDAASLLVAVCGVEYALRVAHERRAADKMSRHCPMSSEQWRQFVTHLRGPQRNSQFWRDLEARGESPAFQAAFMQTWRGFCGEQDGEVPDA